MLMNYLKVWLEILKQFKVSANDALVLEFIYLACSNPKSKHPGWCYASKIYMAEIMNISMRTLYYIFNTLEEKGLIERDESTGWTRTTDVYNTTHLIAQSKEEEEELNARRVQKLQSDSANIAVDTVQKLHTNNNSIKRKDKHSKELTINFEDKFITFFTLYDKKSSKESTVKVWNTLEEETINKIIEHVPKYVAATPDKTYRKNPVNYLKEKCWEDEIIDRLINSRSTINTREYDGNQSVW